MSCVTESPGPTLFEPDFSGLFMQKSIIDDVEQADAIAMVPKRTKAHIELENSQYVYPVCGTDKFMGVSTVYVNEQEYNLVCHIYTRNNKSEYNLSKTVTVKCPFEMYPHVKPLLVCSDTYILCHNHLKTYYCNIEGSIGTEDVIIMTELLEGKGAPFYCDKSFYFQERIVTVDDNGVEDIFESDDMKFPKSEMWSIHPFTNFNASLYMKRGSSGFDALLIVPMMEVDATQVINVLSTFSNISMSFSETQTLYSKNQKFTNLVLLNLSVDNGVLSFINGDQLIHVSPTALKVLPIFPTVDMYAFPMIPFASTAKVDLRKVSYIKNGCCYYCKMEFVPLSGHLPIIGRICSAQATKNMLIFQNKYFGTTFVNTKTNTVHTLLGPEYAVDYMVKVVDDVLCVPTKEKVILLKFDEEGIPTVLDYLKKGSFLLGMTLEDVLMYKNGNQIFKKAIGGDEVELEPFTDKYFRRLGNSKLGNFFVEFDGQVYQVELNNNRFDLSLINWEPRLINGMYSFCESIDHFKSIKSNALKKFNFADINYCCWVNECIFMTDDGFFIVNSDREIELIYGFDDDFYLDVGLSKLRYHVEYNVVQITRFMKKGKLCIITFDFEDYELNGKASHGTNIINLFHKSISSINFSE
ncbi:hypothetical protein PCE1_002388 [Barthelona sp. PCE]